MDDIERMEEGLKNMTVEISELRAKTLDTEFTQEAFQKNEDKTKFCTGLPNFLILLQIFYLCEPYISASSLSALSKFQQLILVLMRLRLNLPLKDLAYRFKISPSTVSRIWHKMINVLHLRLGFLIEWPERDMLQATMPIEFRQAFGTKVAVVIDCFEVLILLKDHLILWQERKRGQTISITIP